MYKKIGLLLWFTLLFTGANCQELTIYVIPPPNDLRWSSPSSLLVSYLENVFVKNKYPGRRHPLGHVLVELKDDTGYHALVGVSARSRFGLTLKVCVKGYGLGILFASIPGRMQEEPENRPEVVKRTANGDIAFIKFRINSAAFERLRRYLETYRSQGYGNIYNGDNKPREGTGAGCSAFAVSFIELAGLLPEDVLNKWTVHVNVPQNLVGGPAAARWVGLHKVLLKRRWANTAKQNYKQAIRYEPGLMYTWILSIWNTAANNSGYKPELMANAKGISIDCTKYYVPTDSIWVARNPIP